MTLPDFVLERAPRPGSSLRFALLVAPPNRRAALAAVAAFSREVDTIVDPPHDPGVAATKLDWWEREIEATAAGRASHPLTQALVAGTPGGVVAAEPLRGRLAGARMDLQQSRFLDVPALLRHAELTGGSLGEAAARLLGATAPATIQFGRRLGQALQLARHVRDVGHDARRGRLYLPVSDLQQHDLKAHEVLRREPPWAYGDRFTALLRLQADRARREIDEATALLPAADRRAQRPLLVAARLHAVLLDALDRRDFPVLHQRVSVSPVRKWWIASFGRTAR